MAAKTKEVEEIKEKTVVVHELFETLITNNPTLVSCKQHPDHNMVSVFGYNGCTKCQKKGQCYYMEHCQVSGGPTFKGPAKDVCKFFFDTRFCL